MCFDRMNLNVLLLHILLVSAAWGQPPGVRIEPGPHNIPRIVSEPVLESRSMISELLVRFQDGTPTAHIQSSIAAVGGTIVDTLEPIGVYRIILTQGADFEAAIKSLGDDPDCIYVEPNSVVRTRAIVPDDPFFGIQWGLHNTGQDSGTADADIDAPEAWDVERGTSNVLVAVVDTGIDWTHPDLAAHIWTNPGEVPNNGIDDDNNGFVDDIRGWDFVNNDNDPMDDNFHGTHVAGIIAAIGNNGEGIAGVSWHTTIMPLKALNESGSGSLFDLANAVLYAILNGAKISNNSWGASFEPGVPIPQLILDVIAFANAEGHIFVASAGNDASDNDTITDIPSGVPLPNVVAVSATDREDNLAVFSNFGANTVDLAAPGVDILSTVPLFFLDPPISLSSPYAFATGTSQAAPHVAGVAALLMARRPDLTHLEVIDLLLSSVDPISTLDGKMLTGGRLNAANALYLTGPRIAVGHYRPAIFPDESVDIFAQVIESLTEVVSIEAEIYRDRNVPPVAMISLFDDGIPPDKSSGDRIYSGQWVGDSQLGHYTIDLLVEDVDGIQTKQFNTDGFSIAHNILFFPSPMLVSPETLNNVRLPVLIEDDGSGYLNNGFLSAEIKVHIWEESLVPESPAMDFLGTGLEDTGFLLETWATPWGDGSNDLKLEGSLANATPLSISSDAEPTQEVFSYVTVEITPSEFGQFGIGVADFRFEEENYGVIHLCCSHLGLGRGDVNANGTIEALDASLVLMHVVKRINLDEPDDFRNDEIEEEYSFTVPPYAQEMADVSGEFGISALDAALIMQRKVGIITYFPAEEGYYRLWDPPAWWNPPSGPPAKNTLASLPIKNRMVSLGPLKKGKDNLLTVPVRINDMEGVLAGTFVLRFNPQHFKPVGVEASELTENCLFADHVQDNTVSVSFAGVDWKVGSGELAKILFKSRTAELGRTARLELVSVQLNEEPVHTQITSLTNTVPHSFSLDQNYPNPFNSATAIRFVLPDREDVELAIFNLAGQSVARLVSGERQAGSYTVLWDGRDDEGRELASGVYLYRLCTDDGQQVETRKLVLIQ